MASSRFLALVAQEADTHVRKSAGYAGRDNPDTWANFRNSLGWGVRPFIGCMVRMTDKFTRAQNLTRDPANDQVGESLIETLMDLSNYAKIGVALLMEERDGEESPIWPGELFVIGTPEYKARLDQVRHSYSLHVDGSDPDATLPGLLLAIGELVEEVTVL